MTPLDYREGLRAPRVPTRITIEVRGDEDPVMGVEMADPRALEKHGTQRYWYGMPVPVDATPEQVAEKFRQLAAAVDAGPI